MAVITDSLRARIADRNGRRYVSPLGDRRERAVPCAICGTDTWALDAYCDTHAEQRYARTITHLSTEAAEALLP